MSTNTFRALDTVVLHRDLPEHGLQRGDLGAIVQVHGSDSFEVEFVRAAGGTQALLTLTAADLRAVGSEELIAVRPSKPRTRGAA